MKYLAAYLLASLSGSAPSKDQVSAILGAVGAEVDADQLAKLLKDLEGKDVQALITEGSSKLASMPSVSAAPAAGGAAPAAAGGAKDAKKEEKKEESEDEDEDMGFGLFD